MNLSLLRAVVVFVLVGLACLALGIWMRAIYAPEWMAPDTTQHPPGLRPWTVEADCYSQLARVQRILKGQGLIQSHFKVENWPEGMVPSTTAPFDYVILLLWAPLNLFTKHPLDWAGALVSPFLWVALAGFWMLFRSREFNLTGRALLLLGSAALPAIIWATACGRPRHQSLIFVLMAMALTAEYERWHIEMSPKRAWNIFAGVAWGLACWTSLYEPAVVLLVLVVFNLIVRRRESIALLAAFGFTFLLALLVEGGHIFGNLFNIYNLGPQEKQYMLNWLSTIAEVQGTTFAVFIWQMTLIFILLPFIAWRLLARSGDRWTDLLLIVLTTLLCIFTAYQSRWRYYAGLGEIFLVARYLQAAPNRWIELAGMLRVGFKTAHWPPGKLARTIGSALAHAVVLLVFLAGLADADRIVVGLSGQKAPNQPSLELAEISRAIDAPGGIMAPWWLSPGLLYFSGHPIVSGSSHCGISGIVDSARFYATTSWAEAEDILRKRQVRWIVIFDNPNYEYPVLNTSRGILGLPAVSDENKQNADATIAQMLVNPDSSLPASLHLRGVTTQLKLYEYVPQAGR